MNALRMQPRNIGDGVQEIYKIRNLQPTCFKIFKNTLHN